MRRAAAARRRTVVAANSSPIDAAPGRLPLVSGCTIRVRACWATSRTVIPAFGPFGVRISCGCGASHECEPIVLARIAGPSARLAAAVTQKPLPKSQQRSARETSAAGAHRGVLCLLASCAARSVSCSDIMASSFALRGVRARESARMPMRHQRRFTADFVPIPASNLSY